MGEGWGGPPADPPRRLGGEQGGGFGGDGFGGGATGGTGGYGATGGYGGPGPYDAPYQPGSVPVGAPIGLDRSGPIDRPGSVTAALAIAIVFGALGSGLGALLLLGGAMVGATSRRLGNDLGEGLSQGSADAQAWGALMGAVGVGITVIGLVLMAWCVAQVVLAIVALRPRNGARIALVVMTAAAAVFQFLGTLRGFLDGDTFAAVIGLCLTIALAAPPALLLGRDANLYYASS